MGAMLVRSLSAGRRVVKPGLRVHWRAASAAVRRLDQAVALSARRELRMAAAGVMRPHRTRTEFRMSLRSDEVRMLDRFYELDQLTIW